MADEEFEIDVYGDDAGNDHGADDRGAGEASAYDGEDARNTNGDDHHDDYHGHRGGTMDDGHDQRSPTPQQRPQQGVKRKEGSDDRLVDPGATSALMISDLNWWNTDDDIRGWIRQANCEGELKEITFSEHKVNGKSKG